MQQAAFESSDHENTFISHSSFHKKAILNSSYYPKCIMLLKTASILTVLKHILISTGQNPHIGIFCSTFRWFSKNNISSYFSTFHENPTDALAHATIFAHSKGVWYSYCVQTFYECMVGALLSWRWLRSFHARIAVIFLGLILSVSMSLLRRQNSISVDTGAMSSRFMGHSTVMTTTLANRVLAQSSNNERVLQSTRFKWSFRWSRSANSFLLSAFQSHGAVLPYDVLQKLYHTIWQFIDGIPKCLELRQHTRPLLY